MRQIGPSDTWTRHVCCGSKAADLDRTVLTISLSVGSLPVAVPRWRRGEGLPTQLPPPKKIVARRPPNLADPKLWIDLPKFYRSFDTLWSIHSQKELVNLMPPDVRF